MTTGYGKYCMICVIWNTRLRYIRVEQILNRYFIPSLRTWFDDVTKFEIIKQKLVAGNR